MPRSTVSASTALKALSSNVFESVHPIEGQGGGRSLGYGGWTIAFGLHAAWASLSDSQHHLRLYSCLGNFLGPSDPTQKLKATTSTLRDTRTFATRHVLISQPQADGSSRVVMSLTADFMKPEPGTFLKYAVKPMRGYSKPESEGVLTWARIEEKARAAGAQEERITLEREARKYFFAKYETRTPVEGFAGQSAKSLIGTDVSVPMDADEPTAKSQAEWYRPKVRMDSYIQALLNIPYILDSCIAFDGGDLNRIDWRTEAAACSSLEFALRIFVNQLDFNDWLLAEGKSVAAGAGRTFQETCLFDRSGNMLAMLSEQCILRPKKEFARM